MKYLYATITPVNILMQKIKIAPKYSLEYAEIDRPSPLTDRKIEQTIQQILSGGLDTDITDKVYADFLEIGQQWILGSNLNNLTGMERFSRLDIINGCTHYIDCLYMSGKVQTLSEDYRYHKRLGLGYSIIQGNIMPRVPMILSMPFPAVGAPHSNMQEILDEAHEKDVPVHIDGAWITCSRDVSFNFNHPAINSVGISLSKGLGLGWNRIGIRWSLNDNPDAISIMNDFHMNNRALTMIGLHFMKTFPVDYLWNTHGKRYEKVCSDFGLTPTNAIHLALWNNRPIGVSPLLRYLENEMS